MADSLTTMKNRIERKIDAARRSEAAALKELERLTRLDRYIALESAEDGTIIRFQRRWSNSSSMAYSYAAIKHSGSRWSTTGPKSPKDYSWQELLPWIVEGLVGSIEMAVAFDDLTNNATFDEPSFGY